MRVLEGAVSARVHQRGEPRLGPRSEDRPGGRGEWAQGPLQAGVQLLKGRQEGHVRRTPSVLRSLGGGGG